MKYSVFLIFLILLNSCQTRRENHLPDLDAIGSRCDSHREAGLNSKAAQLYFETGQNLGSSELFVYSAWQFGKADMADSALIAINFAIENGMNNPKVLDAYNLDHITKNSALRKQTDRRLDSIQQNLKNNMIYMIQMKK